MSIPAPWSKRVLSNFDDSWDESGAQMSGVPSANAAVQPAWATKDLARLSHQLPSSQFDPQSVLLHQSTVSGETATTLWLGGQIACLWLYSLYADLPAIHGKRAIELGAGTGLVTLTLAYLGFDACATDLPQVVDRLQACVAENVDSHPQWKGKARAAGLDWHDEPPEDRDFDLVVATDCVFDTAHVAPLLKMLKALSQKPAATVIVALERRDPRLIDNFLQTAQQFGFQPAAVPKAKLKKLVDAHYGWPREDWADVEVWRFKVVKVK